jgi:hypothetical protein
MAEIGCPSAEKILSVTWGNLRETPFAALKSPSKNSEREGVQDFPRRQELLAAQALTGLKVVAE